jgi:hypothetical protein
LYDLGQRSPKSGLSQADWQALGSNPEAPFAIQPIEHQPDIISFTVLAEDLVAAAELETVRRRAQTFRPEDQQMNQAAADLRWLEEWRQQDASTRLPPMLGETPWRVARRLAETRLAWGQGRWKHALLTLLADPEPAYGEPLQAAWQAYTEAIWRYAWESALDPAGTPPDQLWGMITELEDFRNQPGFGPPAFDHPATSPSPSLRAGSSVFRLAAAAALLHAAWHALRQDWGQAASQIIDALDCLPDDPARQAQILALAQQRYIGNWPAVHAWNLRRWRHEPAIRAAAQRLEQAGVDWARIFLDTLDARQAGRTRERRWLLISAVVVVGLGLASPLLIRPARNVPAPPPVLPPVVAPVASPTLNPAAVLLPLDASRPVTVELAAGDLAMTGLGQAAPLTATTVISPPVPGDLPAQPLFLFTGRLHGPLTQEPGGRLRLAIVWPGRETQPVTVTLLAGKSTGPVIEDWRLNHGGWVWLLGQVPALAEAILACSHAPAGRVCPGQQALLAGPAPLNIDALALAGLQSDGQLTFLASGQPLAQRWVYADLGPYGAQPALPAAARQFVAGHGAGWGLLRLDWDPVHHLFSPAVILHPEANGVYRLWWKNS